MPLRGPQTRSATALARGKGKLDLSRVHEWDLSRAASDSKSVTSRLCAETVKAFKAVLRQVESRRNLSRSSRHRLEKGCSTLTIWAEGYGVREGELDEALAKSWSLRRSVLELLVSIGKALTERLIPRLGLRDDASIDVYALKAATADASATLSEDRRCRGRATPGQGDDSSSSSSSGFSSGADSNELEDTLEDVTNAVQCLLDLEPLIKAPVADREKWEEATGQTALISWSPHQLYSDRIAHRFPKAHNDLIDRLAKANLDRFQRTQDERRRNACAELESEQAPELDMTEADRASRTEGSTKFHDSGIGSSVHAASAYAETTMSYRQSDSHSVRVPPLPNEAKSGIPFECVACSRTVIITSNSAWKKHLYMDLKPWICHDINCKYGDKPFASRQDWVNHLAQQHDFEGSSASLNCPLCQETMPEGKLKIVAHLSAHMEEISLAALPASAGSDADSSNNEVEDDSDSSTHPAVKGHSKNDDDMLSHGSAPDHRLREGTTGLSYISDGEMDDVDESSIEDEDTASGQAGLLNVRKFTCLDPATTGFSSSIRPVKPIASCDACRSGKQWNSSDAAMRHLRRAHFSPLVRGKNDSRPVYAKGSIRPPTSELWLWCRAVGFEGRREQAQDTPSSTRNNVLHAEVQLESFIAGKEQAYWNGLGQLSGDDDQQIPSTKSSPADPTWGGVDDDYLTYPEAIDLAAANDSTTGEASTGRFMRAKSQPVESNTGIPEREWTSDLLADLRESSRDQVHAHQVRKSPQISAPAVLLGSRIARRGSEENVRDHPLYVNAVPGLDGLYHCPWEGTEGCNHKAEKLRCNYDKFVDSHLKPYRCKDPSCEEARFSSTACLLRHEREAHGMHGHGDKPFLCSYDGCERALPGNGFPRQWNLRDHLRRVHDDHGIQVPTAMSNKKEPEVGKKRRKKNSAHLSVSMKPPQEDAFLITSNASAISSPYAPQQLDRSRSSTSQQAARDETQLPWAELPADQLSNIPQPIETVHQHLESLLLAQNDAWSLDQSPWTSQLNDVDLPHTSPTPIANSMWENMTSALQPLSTALADAPQWEFVHDDSIDWDYDAPFLQPVIGDDDESLSSARVDHQDAGSPRPSRNKDKGPRRTYKCDVPRCSRDRNFNTMNDLERHRRSVHPIEYPTPRYQCNLTPCRQKDKIWPRMDNFVTHLRRTHNVIYSTRDDLVPFIVFNPEQSATPSLMAGNEARREFRDRLPPSPALKPTDPKGESSREISEPSSSFRAANEATTDGNPGADFVQKPTDEKSQMPTEDDRTLGQLTNTWSDAEKQAFPGLLRAFGSDWQSMAEHMKTKTAIKMKNQYNRLKSRNGHWEGILHEADNQKRRGERRPDPPTIPT